jgi:PAS domain S-box-containing protein
MKITDVLRRWWWSAQARRIVEWDTIKPFFTAAPAGLIILNADLQAVRLNPKMAEMIGEDADTVLGKTPREAIPLLAPIVEPILRRVSETHEAALNFPVSGEILKQPSVTKHWLASVFPLKARRGQKSPIGAIAVEVTHEVQFNDLARRQAMLEAGEELAKVGSFEHDCESGTQLWSANLCRMLGFGVVGQRVNESAFWKLVHPDDRGHVFQEIKWGMKMGGDYEYEARLILADDREHVFHTRGQVILGANGQPVKRRGVTQDITIRVEMERELKRSELRYRDLVERSHDLLCTHDPDGRIITMNEKPAQILGYPQEYYVGRLIPEMLPPVAGNAYNDYIERIMRDGHAEGLMPVVTRNGQLRIWRYQNVLERDDPRRPIIRGMAHDVTEAEQQKSQLLLFRSMLDMSNDGIEVYDPETLKLVEANLNAYSRLGYLRDEMIGRLISEIDDSVDKEMAEAIQLEVLASGAAIQQTLRRRKNGSTFHVEAKFSTLSLGREYLVAVVRDITERKCLEDNLASEGARARNLARVARSLTRPHKVRGILSNLLRKSTAIMNAPIGLAAVYGDHGQDRAVYLDRRDGEDAAYLMSEFKIADWVFANRKLYLSNDLEHDDFAPSSACQRIGLKSVLCVPINDHRNNEMIGFLAVFNRAGGFTEQDIETLEALSEIAAPPLLNSLSRKAKARGASAD